MSTKILEIIRKGDNMLSEYLRQQKAVEEEKPSWMGKQIEEVADVPMQVAGKGWTERQPKDNNHFSRRTGA